MNNEARCAYIAEHIAQCLSTDERVHALGIQVSFVDDQFVLAGQVYCESRRADIEEVAREHAPPDASIDNQIVVARVDGAVDEENVG